MKPLKSSSLCFVGLDSSYKSTVTRRLASGFMANSGMARSSSAESVPVLSLSSLTKRSYSLLISFSLTKCKIN